MYIIVDQYLTFTSGNGFLKYFFGAFTFEKYSTINCN